MTRALHVNRSNEEWLADLRADAPQHNEAVEALRARLEQGLYFYLSHERSDLQDRSEAELRHMAQDFAQEALLKILSSLDTFRGESQFLTWASKIAARLAISELRRARYKDYSLDHLTAEDEIMPTITTPGITPDQGPHPERYTEQQDIMALLQDAIHSTLTERQRTALLAAVLDGIPLDEIARRMGTNRNALYKLLHDARLKLKQHLEGYGISPAYVLDLFGESS